MLLYNNVAGLRQIKGIMGNAVADRHQGEAFGAAGGGLAWDYKAINGVNSTA
jgi:hypothetical protein